jgi:hypothetical protein
VVAVCVLPVFLTMPETVPGRSVTASTSHKTS